MTPEHHAAPARFLFAEGDYFEGSRSIELVEDALLWTPAPLSATFPAHDLRIRPTPEDWSRFRRAIDRLRVWGWESQYVNDQIIDGGWWHLEVTWEGRSLESHGTNAFPRGWRGFRCALWRLTREAGWFDHAAREEADLATRESP